MINRQWILTRSLKFESKWTVEFEAPESRSIPGGNRLALNRFAKVSLNGVAVFPQRAYRARARLIRTPGRGTYGIQDTYDRGSGRACAAADLVLRADFDDAHGYCADGDGSSGPVGRARARACPGACT